MNFNRDAVFTYTQVGIVAVCLGVVTYLSVTGQSIPELWQTLTIAAVSFFVGTQTAAIGARARSK